MTTSRAILIAGVLIAAAILVVTRYEFAADFPAVYRFDHLTGAMTICFPQESRCEPLKEK